MAICGGHGVGPHPSAQGLILAQRRITKEVIVAECSQAESQLHLTSCAYEPSHKSELMLRLSKGDHCLTPHPLLVLATRTGRLFAVISACSRWEGNWRLSHLAWPSVQRPRRPRARGPSFPRARAETGSSALRPCATAVALDAGIASALRCSEKAVPLATCNKLGLFQASR